MQAMKLACVILVLVPALNSATPAQQPTTLVARCGDPNCQACTSADHECLLDRIFADEPSFEGLKAQSAGPVTYSVGGQLRHRYMNERNRLRPPGAAASEYSLWRFNPHIDIDYDGIIGARVEGIHADAFGYDTPLFPLGIDRNRWDLLQAYADIKLMDVGDDGYVKYRYGRQVLKYGSQHLLSPLAWANTFRNFEGHKVLFKNGDWTIDGFHMQSVNGAAGGSNFGVSTFDRPDRDRQISGIYSTYSGFENSTLDLYWLHFNERNDDATRMDGRRNTFGIRVAGTEAIKESGETLGTWNWDIEGAWQNGTDDFVDGTNQDVQAWFLSAIGGYQFNDVPWAPKINGIFYYGSGDGTTGDGELNTFFSLYPLGHAYWGLIDNFSGQNLIDAGVVLTAKPHKKLTLVTAWHNFRLAEANDNLYNIAGAPFALANDEIGSEVDVVATLSVSKNLNVQLGHLWFLYGSGVSNSAFRRNDARQIYLQTTLSF